MFFESFKIEDNIVKAQIWDTAGQERYRSITSSYYKGAKGCLLVYDISKKKSFENIDKWISQFKETADNNIYVLLIGNKCDLENEREVQSSEAKQLADSWGIEYMETSAKTGYNIKEVFVEATKLLYNKYKENKAKQNEKNGERV